MAKVGIQIWQFDTDYGQGNIPDDDTQIPMSVAVVKTNWSLSWMRTVDAAPSVESLDGVRRVAGVYRSQGIDFIPWGEAHGGAKAYDEGYLMGQIAEAAGRGVYMLDLESGPVDYWNAAPGAVQRFLQGFRDGGGRELWVEPDARRGHEVAIQLDDWLADSIVTRWYPQTYWQDFYPNHSGNTDRVLWAIEAATVNLREGGVLNSRIFPVFNGDDRSTRVEWEVGLDHLRRNGYGGVMVWRRGTMSREVMDLFASLPEDQMPGYVPPVPPAPTPEPDFLTPIRAAREFAQATVVTLDAVIEANAPK